MWEDITPADVGRSEKYPYTKLQKKTYQPDPKPTGKKKPKKRGK